MAMSREQREEQAKAYGRLVANCWSDEAFKQRLLANPTAVLQEAGMPVPEGTEVRVVENTDRLVYLPLPVRPRELSDEQLDAAAGGTTYTNKVCDPSYSPF